MSASAIKLQLKASVQVTTRSAAPGFKITIKMNGLGIPELDENSYNDALALTGPYPPSKVSIGDNLRVVLTKFDPGITSIGGSTFQGRLMGLKTANLAGRWLPQLLAVADAPAKGSEELASFAYPCIVATASLCT
jgi:hypothetical protein